jgi:hypothetical protein
MMSRSFISVLLLVGMCAFFAPSADAATATAGPFVTQASVAGGLTLAVVMKKNDFNGATIPSMDFGQLTNIGTGTLRSSPSSTTGTGAVDCFITANSQGLPYTITQTGTAVANGAAVLPAGACVVKAVYAAADNGGLAMPSGALLGTASSWVSTGKLIYQSETGTALMRTVQAFYSITDDTTAGATSSVPLSQTAGTYSGTVTFTVTA